MNFSFLPFQLQDHITKLQPYLTCKETDNKKSRFELDINRYPKIMDIKAERITLCYCEKRLISAYILISKRNAITAIMQQMQEIEQRIGFAAKETETGNLLSFSWADDKASFSINIDGDIGEVYLYLTLKEYLV